MNLINNKDFLHNVAQHLNLFNTIAGGISETNVKIEKYRKGAVIELWAAGVSAEAFKVMVHKNELTVYSLLHSTDNEELSVPMFSKVFVIPPQVDISNIEAVYQDGKIQVKLPYHNAAIRPKEIEIKQL